MKTERLQSIFTLEYFRCPNCDCEGDDSNIISRCKSNGILIDIHQT